MDFYLCLAAIAAATIIACRIIGAIETIAIAALDDGDDN
jgi:hypothetical protein